MFALHLVFGSIMAMTAMLALAVSKPGPHTIGLVKEAPATATQTSTKSSAQTILYRHSDGLFYIEAQANGQTVRFVVDTGATVVVLNQADATKLGATFDERKPGGSIRTVRGPSAIRWATIEKLEVLGRQLDNVSVAVVDGALPVSLMGHNVLMQLGAVTLQGDTLAIR